MSEELFIPNSKRSKVKESTETQQDSTLHEYSGQNTYTSYSYYRSELFTLKNASKPLVAAAMPLLCLLARLHTLKSPDLERLREQLQHELHSFTSAAEAQRYPVEVVVMSRYLLSVTFDEWIAHSEWPERQKWAPLAAQEQMQASVADKENALEIPPLQQLSRLCERLMGDPKPYQEWLHLFYLCFSQGFEADKSLGQHSQTKEPLTVGTLCKKILDVLQAHQPQFNMLGADVEIPLLEYAASHQASVKTHWWTVGLISGGVLVGLYFLLGYLLQVMTHPLAGQVATLGY